MRDGNVMKQKKKQNKTKQNQKKKKCMVVRERIRKSK